MMLERWSQDPKLAKMHIAQLHLKQALPLDEMTRAVSLTNGGLSQSLTVESAAEVHPLSALSADTHIAVRMVLGVPTHMV